jgi:hypothetical protein
VREVDPADTRARLLRVTGTGADLALRAIAAVEAADAAFFAATPDLPALVSLLRPLAVTRDPVRGDRYTAGVPGLLR